MNDWTKEENQAIVKDYFSMLLKELSFENYNKTTHRKDLLNVLNNRSEGAVEKKHGNISAILIKMGLPFINGYKPYYNYQIPLYNEISSLLGNDESILKKVHEFVNKEIRINNELVDFNNVLIKLSKKKEDRLIPNPILEERIIPFKTNFLEREQTNRNLGNQGEEFVFNYEKWRLNQEGRSDLVKSVEWVSKDYGDGFGYDILSKNYDGSVRHIEVKTTKMGRYTPIFVSRNENEFSKHHQNSYHVYRVFDCAIQPKMYIMSGAISKNFDLTPVSFTGSAVLKF